MKRLDQGRILKRGMHIRRTGSSSSCSIGPFFTDGANLYFFTVEHGVGGMGDRTVEATLDGYKWETIGTYVTGKRDEYVDWAIVRIDDAGITFQLPQDLTAPATGVGYYYQRQDYALFRSSEIKRGNLSEAIEKSPTMRDQFICVTQRNSDRANVGVSGMGVYTAQRSLLGIEWAIEWDGFQKQHTFYVEPFENVAESLIEQVTEYDNRYRNSRAPARVWQEVKPIADSLFEQEQKSGPQAKLEYILHNTQ